MSRTVNEDRINTAGPAWYYDSREEKRQLENHRR